MLQLFYATLGRSEIERRAPHRKNEYARFHAGQFGEKGRLDRKAQLSMLLARIQREGAQAHEEEIDRLRAANDLTEKEREIVREIFCLGFDAAEKEHRQDKMWDYRYLLLRLLLHQPLDQALPFNEPSLIMPRKTAAQLAAPSVENQFQQENAPNRFRKRALRRQLVRYGFFLGGAAALLWIVYADRSLIGGRDLYPLAITDPRNSIPAIPASELMDAANFEPLIERASVTQPAPAMNKDLSVEAGAVMTENSAVAVAGATTPSSTSAESRESPMLDVPSESLSSSLPVYRTVRQILLREEPRFGVAAEIMLDRGARLIVLEINGPWLKVKMEKTGAPGFVRKEFVVPAEAAGP